MLTKEEILKKFYNSEETFIKHFKSKRRVGHF